MKWTAWLILTTLLVSWSLSPTHQDQELNQLSKVRQWALKQSLWPEFDHADLSSDWGREFTLLAISTAANRYLLLPCDAYVVFLRGVPGTVKL